MDVRTRKDAELTVINASGKITLYEGTSQLRNQIRELVAEDNKKLLLNMSGVTYMDSTGIDCLIASYVTVQKAGGVLKFACLPDRINHLMEITQLNTVFEVFEDEEAARASF